MDGIPVVDTVRGPPAPGRGLQELVPDPSRGRTGGDVEEDQLSPLVADAEEDVEGPEAHRLDDEQVGGPDAAELVCQEGSPVLVGARPQPAPTISADGTVAHDDAEFQQFSPNAFSPPERILLGDPADGCLQLGPEAGSTEPSSGLPPPIQSPTLPVPAQDRLRLHHMEVLSPILGPDMAKPDPENPIPRPEAGMRVGAQGDLEVMAEDQVLEREIPARSNGRNEGAKDKQE